MRSKLPASGAQSDAVAAIGRARRAGSPRLRADVRIGDGGAVRWSGVLGQRPSLGGPARIAPSEQATRRPRGRQRADRRCGSGSVRLSATHGGGKAGRCWTEVGGLEAQAGGATETSLTRPGAMMRYDATRAALLHPEGQATLFSPGQNWSIEGVCAECSRLAYVRFETDDRNKAALTEAIACAGLGEPGFFSDPGTGTQAYTAIDTHGSRAFVVFSVLVTRLPPAFLGYVHVPGMMYIDRNGKVQPQATEALIEADTAIARREYLINESWRFGNAGVRDLADHSPVNYVSGVLQDRT